MGVVYAAVDRERDELVALKTIREGDVETVYRLKREFRALADLGHPNLVALHDLFVDAGSCFFTMELVEGVDLLAFVREQASLAHAPTLHSTGVLPDLPSCSLGSQPAAVEPWDPALRGRDTVPAPGPLACDEARLRVVLPQLAQGLAALHAAGKIHRDIKPPNILVTGDARVVLLDFGLVAAVDHDPDVREGNLVGTVAYMAPEQAAGEAQLGPAADWYAVGVILYEALTGRLPFQGAPSTMIREKLRHAPPPPRALCEGVPRDLDDLCTDLLAREAGERPTGAEVLRRLGVGADARGRTSSISLSRSGECTGRQAELAVLDAAFSSLARGKPAVAAVVGPSGIGKSTLVQHFLRSLRWRSAAPVVLSGRCYARETVAYNAMDSLIDDLSSYWLSLPPDDARAILPPEAALLETLFPVLGRVPVVANAARSASGDPQELRTRAFGALRALLARMAARGPVVLFLDDVQWVDANTTALLAGVMRPPDPPPLLLLLSARQEGQPVVEALQRAMDAERHVVHVGPLDDAAAAALARQWLGETTASLVEQLTAEAAGSPFLLRELARALEGTGERDLSRVARRGLDGILADRIDGLPAASTALLEVLAVAGEPVSLRDAARAAEVPPEQASKLLRLLRAQHLLRAASAQTEIEPYHDRIRETLLARMPEERRRARHRGLATALAGAASAERLARHWEGAAEPMRAAEYAEQAAGDAIGTLDFERAAGLLRMALQLGRHPQDAERTLRTRLGEALMCAGRPGEAAAEFDRAADGADRTAGLELRRRSADARLRGGYLEAGLGTMRVVLGEIGLRLPRTPRRALGDLLWGRLRVRLRGLAVRPRPRSALAPEALMRVDVCEAVAMGLSMVDVIRSTAFGSRFLLAALRLGEPERLARALGLEAVFLSAQRSERRASRLLVAMERLAASHAHRAHPILLGSRGFLEFFCRNRWRAAARLFEQAETEYRAQHAAAGFEIDTAQLFGCWALTYLGELDEVGRRVPALVRAAERRGDRYAAVTLRSGFQGVWLVRDDDVAEAERDVTDAIRSWAPAETGFHVQHFVALYTRLDLLLYAGDHRRARALLEQERPAMHDSLIDRMPLNRCLIEHQETKLLQAELAEAPPSARAGLLARLGRLRRRQARDRQPLSQSYAQLTAAGLAHAEGDLDRSIAELRRALARLESEETFLYANATRRRLGQALGGDEGRQLIGAADAWMTKQGVKNPARMAAMLLPGWPG